MKKYSTLFLALVTLVLNVKAQLSSQNVTIGNTNRSYLEYLPANFNPATEEYSLVIILHGIGGTSDQMVEGGFNDVADTARVIALYPQALNNNFNITAWNNGTLLASEADDIGFMNELMDLYISSYNVNPSRVYVAGFSMGSIMSYHLACALNNRIAAVGCMAGTMATSDIASCNPSYATPVIHMHGTADGTVPYDGTALPSLSLVPQTMEFWQNVHDCDANPSPIAIPNVAADNITVDRFVYANCTTEGALELWRLNGADHIYLYEPLNDITQMIEVWLFMRKWSHPNPLAVFVDENETNAWNVFPNPVSDVLSVTAPNSCNYQIWNATGQLIETGNFKEGLNLFDVREYQSGIYFITSTESSIKKRFIKK